MHRAEDVSVVLTLGGQGYNASEISPMTGIPRSTVRDWMVGNIPGSAKRACTGACEVCGGDAHPFDALSTSYVYLLGLYLGDGSISSHPRGVYRLRIALDMKYPGIVSEAEAAMRTVVPYNRVTSQLTPKNYYEVHAYSKSWPCILPQHGAGRKHERRIILADWQQEFVRLVPDLLLRGLIHSDGCRFMNTGTKWAFPRYSFSNVSDDIKEIFCDACDRLDLRWTRSGDRTIYVSRMADIAVLDRFVGPKY